MGVLFPSPKSTKYLEIAHSDGLRFSMYGTYENIFEIS